MTIIVIIAIFIIGFYAWGSISVNSMVEADHEVTVDIYLKWGLIIAAAVSIIIISFIMYHKAKDFMKVHKIAFIVIFFTLLVCFVIIPIIFLEPGKHKSSELTFTTANDDGLQWDYETHVEELDLAVLGIRGQIYSYGEGNSTVTFFTTVSGFTNAFTYSVSSSKLLWQPSLSLNTFMGPGITISIEDNKPMITFAFPGGLGTTFSINMNAGENTTFSITVEL